MGVYYAATYKEHEFKEYKMIFDHLGMVYSECKVYCHHDRILYSVKCENATPYQQREAHRLTSLVGRPGTDIPEWRRK